MKVPAANQSVPGKCKQNKRSKLVIVQIDGGEDDSQAVDCNKVACLSSMMGSVFFFQSPEHIMNWCHMCHHVAILA